MKLHTASGGVSSRHSGKPKGLIRNLDSRFRGNDRNAPRGGVLNPGFTINDGKDKKALHPWPDAHRLLPTSLTMAGLYGGIFDMPVTAPAPGEVHIAFHMTGR